MICVGVGYGFSLILALGTGLAILTLFVLYYRVAWQLGMSNSHLELSSKESPDCYTMLHALLHRLDAGVLLIDQNGFVQASNQTIAAILGLAPEQLQNQHWDQINAEIASDFPYAWIDATFQDGQLRSGRQTVTSGQGMRSLDIRVFTLPGSSPDNTWLIVHTVDVTEQLQLETRVIAQEQLATKERLVATVAHEVNTPLQAIENCLHLAEQAPAIERPTYVKLAREEVHRIGTMMHQLLDVFRPRAHEYAPIDLNVLIKRVVLLLGNTIAKQGVMVELQLMPNLPLMNGRSDELTQVLINLVTNAWQAMPSGGRLQLSTEVVQLEANRPVVVVTVTDTGIGIAPEAQTKIFTSLYTTKPDGSGLGLTISRTIIEAHSGEISVQSAPGAGSRFIVRFPL